MKKYLVIGGALLLAAALSVSVPWMVESNIPTAYYITPNLRTYENVINCTGTIQSETVRQIYIQTAAVASDVFVSVGDEVKRGDLLLRLDSAKTAQMNAPLSLVRDAPGGGGDSGVDWSSLAAAYGLNSVVNGMSPSELNALGDALTQTQDSAAGGTILEELDYGEITAPISGVVTEVDIQPQIPVTGGKAIITIADNENYKTLVTIREEDIARIQVGDGAVVRGVGFSGYTYSGVISKIYPTARKVINGSASETVVDAEIALDAPDFRLKPGFSAKVEILGGNDYNLITVPYEAIRQDENNNEYVYLYEEGKLVKKVVVTGQELTNEVEILSGVSQDSIVVYNPSDAVQEGAMVHIKGKANVD